MKKLWNWKWRSIPMGIVSAVLIVCLLAGGVLAAYNFAQVKVEVVVEEAIVLGYNWCPSGDDLAPYMVGGTVLPEILLAPGTGGYDLDVTIQKEAGVDASEFCPGETLVIPLNLRNRSDGAINLNVASGSSDLEVTFQVNDGGWDDSVVAYVLAGHSGTFGSDTDCDGERDAGAIVLYVKIHAPGDCPTGSQVFGLDFSRN